ncbi:MAG: arylsulfotransferase family protein [Actinomycetota bacterium]|nr:aryl-sulfate sulfotransferase [Actinomycetota bacterium]
MFSPPPSKPRYIAIYDTAGVPVWWTSTAARPLYSALLSDGNLAATFADGTVEEIRFDGSVAHVLRPTIGTADFHDLQLLRGGNYLIVTNIARSGMDLTSWGGPNSAVILDQVIQEISPNGALVWSWDAYNHIARDETDPQWRSQVLRAGAPYDIFHWNSIEPTDDGVIVSYRHLDAVYKINKGNSSIEWKLGGSPRSESLTIDGDPVFAAGGGFGGQHDARLLQDGTLTLHDNGTGRSRSPRAVRYKVDMSSGRATLISDLVDSSVTGSICCGGARRLIGGNWVTSWGANPWVTEYTGRGDLLFRLTFVDGNIFSYRADPVSFGRLPRGLLREGMDSQYPRTK